MVNLQNWAHAIEREFFPDNNHEEEVYLYLSDNIIEEIGQKHRLGGVEDFLNTVLVPRDRRHDLYLGLARSPNTAENRIIEGNNILRFAALLNQNINVTNSGSVALLYAALVMYIGNEAIENGIPIGRYIRTYLRKKLGDNGDYRAISTLFEQVNKKFPSFNNNLKTEEEYVGLIKYQLILSPNEIAEVEQALYRIQYDDHDYTNFVEKVNRVYDYVSDSLKEKLREAIRDRNYQERFNAIFRNFDVADYSAQHNVGEVKQHAYFALVLDFSSTDGRRGFHIVSNYRPDRHLVVGDYELCPSMDSLGAYNNKYVVYRGVDYVSLQEYHLASDKLDIRSLPLGDVLQFYRQDEGVYLQSRGYFASPVYIIVNLANVHRWETWAETRATNLRRLDQQYDVADLTNGRWALYYADLLSESYYDADNAVFNDVVSGAEIVRKESIKQIGKKNTYLVNALPYFEFPNAIDRSKLRLILRIEVNRERNESIELSKDKYQVLINDKRLMLDITSDIDYTRSTRVDVEISYSDAILGDLEKKDNFYVSGQQIAYEQDRLYRYDSWGDLTDEDNDAFIQGNKITYNVERPLGRNRVAIDKVDDVPDESFYFINLLASTMYMESDAKITRDRLRKCIRYASTRNNVNINQKGFIAKTVDLLENCGYVAVDYASSKYQAIPPCFSKIPRSFQEANHEQVWMLTGTYTRMFLGDLRKFCSERGISVKYKYSDRIRSSEGHLRLLPPIVLIGGRFSPEEFMNECGRKHKFDYYTGVDHGCNLLSFAECVSNYECTMRRIPRGEMTINLFESSVASYPRIREDNPDAYNNHKYVELSENGDFLMPMIGRDWCNLYCHYMRKSPFVIKEDRHIYIPEKLHLPSIIQRSLFSMNVGIASYKKAFICNYESDNRVYTTVKSYVIDNDRLDVLKERLALNNNYLFIPRTKTDTTKWRYEMAIWRRKDEIDASIPKVLYVLSCVSNGRNAERSISALAFYLDGAISAFVPKQLVLTRVNNYNCNSLFSSLITDLGFNNDKLEFDDVTFTLPDEEKYDIEEIMIL